MLEQQKTDILSTILFVEIVFVALTKKSILQPNTGDFCVLFAFIKTSAQVDKKKFFFAIRKYNNENKPKFKKKQEEIFF